MVLLNSNEEGKLENGKVDRVINEMIDKVNWGKADIMVIDLPPGTGDVQISLAQKL